MGKKSAVLSADRDAQWLSGGVFNLFSHVGIKKSPGFWKCINTFPAGYHAKQVSKNRDLILYCCCFRLMAGVEIADRRFRTDGRGIAGRCVIVNNEKTRFSPLSENREISARKSGLA
jgi:hypothetical protein